MKVLVDTSIWSKALRRQRNTDIAEVLELQQLIKEHRVEVIGAIRQEILSGIKEQSQFDWLQQQLLAFPDITLLSEDYVTAASFYNICRAKGVQGSNTDFLICAVAVNRKLSIFTCDKDFTLFSKHLLIELHTARP